MAMDVKAAATVAKNYAADLMEDEGITNIGVEEVEFDDAANEWLVTIGFSRPWNSVRTIGSALSGERAARRSYRVLRINDATMQVLSMKRRSGSDSDASAAD